MSEPVGLSDLGRNLAAMGVVDDWFPRLGLLDCIQRGHRHWTATATWPGDRMLPYSDDDPTPAHLSESEPHFIRCDGTEILCEGMEQYEWAPLDFIALAMDWRTPQGGWDTERAWRFVKGEDTDPESESVGDRAAALFGQLMPMDEIEPQLESRYLVKGWIDQGAASVVYGDSNVGKTFFALDMAAHVAAGMDWHGHVTAENNEGEAVIYVAAEGGHGIRNRFKALRLARPDLSVPNLMLLPTALDFFQPGDAVAFVTMAHRHGINPRLVILDTLARTIGEGDENVAKDMGRYVANMDALREYLACHVMVIHHAGKDTTKGARGSGSLRAAVDTEIELQREHGVTVAGQRKQRDMPTGEPFGYVLRDVFLGHDEDGDEVKSAVIEPTEIRRDTSKITGAAGVALRALDAMLDAHGETMEGNLLPADRPGVPVGLWRAECDLRRLSKGDAESSQRMAFNRAKAKLINANVVGEAGDWVWRATDD